MRKYENGGEKTKRKKVDKRTLRERKIDQRRYEEMKKPLDEEVHRLQRKIRRLERG